MHADVRHSLAAVSLALAACAAPPVSPSRPPQPTDIRPVSRTFLEELIVRRKVTGVTMSIYNTGTVRTPGIVVSSLKSAQSDVHLDVPAFLIRHPQGRILFDTGISTATAAFLDRFTVRSLKRSYKLEYETRPELNIISQLRAGEVEPGDVRWIILSNLHLDHAGLAGNFPNATIVVSKKEWETQKRKIAARGGDAGGIFDPTAFEKRFKIQLIDFSTAPPLGVFDHGVDLFADGSIFLLPLPGRTPGTMGAWVNVDGGPVLLAGDGAWVVDNYLDLSLPIQDTVDDLREYWRTENQLHAMADIAPRLVIFPGHDLSPRAITSRNDLPLMTPPFEMKEGAGKAIFRWLKGELEPETAH